MDRNNTQISKSKKGQASLSARRAWIEIGAKADSVTKWTASLSARRAWIEIGAHYDNYNLHCVVALRKESVDRNLLCGPLSMRTSVALRKESVDRNRALAWKLTVYPSRSPQGERG